MLATVCSAGDPSPVALLLCVQHCQRGGSAQGCSGHLREALPGGISLILVFPKLRTCRGEFCSDEVMIKTPVVVCWRITRGGSWPALKVRMCNSAQGAAWALLACSIEGRVCVRVLSAVLAPQVST